MPAKRLFILLLLVFGPLRGCNHIEVQTQRQPDAASVDLKTDPQTGSAVMAMVNDKPIYMSSLHEVLIDAHGMEMAWQLIAMEVVRQELHRKGFSIAASDVLAENDNSLKEVFGEGFNPAEREKLLGQLLGKRGIPRRQWDMTITRNAMLRKLAEPRVKVTDEDLKAQFAEQFGRRVVARHIQTESLAQAQMVLTKLRKPRADFAQLAWKYSRNRTAKNGGKLPAIGVLTPPEIPTALRKAALAMEKIGQISQPIQVGTVYHILMLEKVISPRTEKFEAVKDKLHATIRARRVNMIRQQILRDLLAKAKVVYAHPSLRDD
jgi:hypothetical protein